MVDSNMLLHVSLFMLGERGDLLASIPTRKPISESDATLRSVKTLLELKTVQTAIPFL